MDSSLIRCLTALLGKYHGSLKQERYKITLLYFDPVVYVATYVYDINIIFIFYILSLNEHDIVCVCVA
jgi:hypothetical protein